MACLAKEEFKLAENSLDSAILLNPANGKGFLNRGIARFRQLNFEGAEKDFQIALSFDYNEAFLYLAKLYAEQNKPAQSVASLNKYLEKITIANPYKVFKDESLRKIHNSNEWQDFINNFHPTQIQESIINAEQNLVKQNYFAAHQVIIDAQVHNPASAILFEYNSEIYAKEGNITLARTEIKKAVNIAPGNIEYLCKLADYDYSLGDYQSAYKNYQVVNASSPEYFIVYTKLARTCLKLKKPAESKKLSFKFLEFFPNDTSAILLNAKSDFELKDYKSTLISINSLMKKYPPHADWFLLRGMTYYETNTFNSAAYDLSMSLDLNPNNLDANYYMGLAEIEKGNKQLACYYFQRALKLGDNRAYNKIEKNCDSK
jgi:tetratricopeptide (TPR) repeat protein